MVRSQIILDEDLLAMVRAHAEHTNESMSSVVRRALRAYFGEREPDTSWIGGLRPAGNVSHRMEDIRESIERGWTEESRR